MLFACSAGVRSGRLAEDSEGISSRIFECRQVDSSSVASEIHLVLHVDLVEILNLIAEV